jgi:hypothetical protein
MTNPKGDPSEGSYLYLINARWRYWSL